MTALPWHPLAAQWWRGVCDACGKPTHARPVTTGKLLKVRDRNGYAWMLRDEAVPAGVLCAACDTNRAMCGHRAIDPPQGWRHSDYRARTATMRWRDCGVEVRGGFSRNERQGPCEEDAR